MVSVLTLWVIIASITAFVAKGRQRSTAAWFALGLLLNFFALIFLLLLPEKVENSQSDNSQLQTAAKEIEEKLDFTQIQENKEPIIRMHPNDVGLEWWYLTHQNSDVVKKGPFTFGELKEYASSEHFTKNTYIWSEELSAWTSLNKITNGHLLFEEGFNDIKKEPSPRVENDFNSFGEEKKA